MVEGTPLMLVSSVKYLGIQINSDLSWSPHVANLCNKARRLIGLLYRRFYRHTDSTTLLQLYKTFIRPHLEYCSIVWDPSERNYISNVTFPHSLTDALMQNYVTCTRSSTTCLTTQSPPSSSETSTTIIDTLMPSS